MPSVRYMVAHELMSGRDAVAGRCGGFGAVIFDMVSDEWETEGP